MDTNELLLKHDPDMYGKVVTDVFTNYLGSQECANLNKEEKMAVIDLYNELDRFFHDECSKQEKEMAAIQRKTA